MGAGSGRFKPHPEPGLILIFHDDKVGQIFLLIRGSGFYHRNLHPAFSRLRNVDFNKKKVTTYCNTEVFGSTGSVGDGRFVPYSRKSVTLDFFNANFNLGIAEMSVTPEYQLFPNPVLPKTSVHFFYFFAPFTSLSTFSPMSIIVKSSGTFDGGGESPSWVTFFSLSSCAWNWSSITIFLPSQQWKKVPTQKETFPLFQISASKTMFTFRPKRYLKVAK